MKRKYRNIIMAGRFLTGFFGVCALCYVMGWTVELSPKPADWSYGARLAFVATSGIMGTVAGIVAIGIGLLNDPD